MKQLEVYLNFADGACEEALQRYADILGGEVVSIQRFAEGPMEVDAAYQQRIMHAEFRAGEGLFFLASDTMPGQPVQVGNNMTLVLSLEGKEEQKQIFDQLADGGQVNMPLQDTFWGATFGMLTDRYGINWMLSRGGEG